MDGGRTGIDDAEAAVAYLVVDAVSAINQVILRAERLDQFCNSL